MIDKRKTTTGKRGTFSLGDVLIERGKRSDNDIGDIWEEQKRLREQDTLLEIEYKQAREKAKQLKTKIKQHKIGDETIFGDELKKYMPGSDKSSLLRQDFTKYLRRVKEGSKPLALAASKRLRRMTKRQIVLTAVVTLVVLSFAARPLVGRKGDQPDSPGGTNQTGTLGDSTVSGGTTADLPEVDSLEFQLAYPAGVNPDNVKVVKVNPENTATVYAFVDKLSDSQLRISEQRVPESFSNDQDTELLKLANNFNAKSVIQVDNMKVYHGKNESGSTKQSLIFIKNNLLVFIASSNALSDDTWAAYIGSFN